MVTDDWKQKEQRMDFLTTTGKNGIILLLSSILRVQREGVVMSSGKEPESMC